MKLVMAQLNFSLGDIQYNQNVIINTIEQHRGADIILFPELFLTGYPPEDLLLRHGFYENLNESMLAIQSRLKGETILLGTPRHQEGKLYNSCAVLQRNTTIRYIDKQFLPNYSVFDEKRYFVQGEPGHNLVEVAGKQCFVAICEDVWNEAIWQQARAANANVMLSLHASPYFREKRLKREKLLRDMQKKYFHHPVVYVNYIGGQDELVFDGNSFVLDENGQKVCQLPSFQQAVETITIGNRVSGSVTPPLTGYEEIYQALVLGLRDYMHKNRFQRAVLGLSGGIDSALTACIARDAIGSENVLAVSMPSRFTRDISKADALTLAENLAIELKEIPIELIFQMFLNDLSPHFENHPPDLTEENLQARVRGTLLMALSNKLGHLVISTSNKSELAVGYSTLYGDSVGGFAILKDVYKTDVYALAHWINRDNIIIPERIITRAPSAELRDNQSDQDTLPEYPLLDKILQGFIEDNMNLEELLLLHNDKTIIQQIIRLVKKSEYKRRQSPPGVKTTKRAFGRDWRYPISENYPYARSSL